MKRNFYDFCEIIKKLREPGGCPWDREQTHTTLRKHIIEEAYEAHDAIEEGIPEKMADELGDVLLQIVMHAQIGAESGEFTIDDVTEAACEKMVTRHPHVFGKTSVTSSDEVLTKWDEIKKQERHQTKLYESLETITRSLPALTKCDKVISKSIKGGFLEESTATTATEEEIGAALFEICRLSRKSNINPEEALSSYIKKFIKKIKNIEENT